MFQNNSMRWRIALPFILLNLIILIGLALFVSNFIEQKTIENLRVQLETDARLVNEFVVPQLASARQKSNLDPLADYYYQLLGNKVTLISADGIVLGQSGGDDLKSGNLYNYPDIQQARAEGSGTWIAVDPTTGEDTLYASIKAETNETVIGYVRLALPLGEVEKNQKDIRNSILAVTFFTILITTLLAWLIANRSALPVRALTETVDLMAEGDLDARLKPTTRDEIGQLTNAFNNMAEQLQEKINALTTEQQRLSVILEHMADGIMILDSEGIVQMINLAAARLLGTTPQSAINRRFSEVVRHHQIIELWQRSQLETEENREFVEMVETSRNEGRILQVIITSMTSNPFSRLVILQDLTRIRRLETIRRDFISNISHDLRTPLASLSLLVETMQNGALQDPPAAERFLKHMDQEVSVMTQLVSELLELSRIESGQVPLKLQPVRVYEDLILPPLERLTGQAERNGVKLYTEVTENLPLVSADADRIHQVVTNLLHNAIKFTPPNGSIKVFTYTQYDEVVIGIRDTGVGIAPEDANRIFERFYKTDRARSKGGMGLGLAIAKHLVQAHGGSIWLESQVGQGSTFYFVLKNA